MSMQNQDRAAEYPEPNRENDAEVDDIFSAAQRRMSQRRSAPINRPAPAGAIKALHGSANPIDRYLANRNARDATMRALRFKLRHVAKLLVEAGFSEGAGFTSTYEFPWHRIRVADADAFTRLLARRYTSAKSRENYLGVVRSLLRHCVRAGLLDRRSCDELLDALPVRSGETIVAGRELDDEELVAIQRAAMKYPNPVLALRNSAVVAIFQSTGLRLSEVVDLDVSDYRPSDRSLLLRVTKSNRPARVWLNDWAVERLDAWLAIRSWNSGPLFLSWTGGRLSASGVGTIVSLTVRDAGITRRTTSHDFRRTFITRMLRAGIDPFTVRRLVNHKNVTTTMIYDRRTDAEDRQAVERLQLPNLRTGGTPNRDVSDEGGSQ